MASTVVGANGKLSKDSDLEQTCLDVLKHYPGRRIWADEIEIKSHDGIVELGGHVRTRVEKELFGNIVHGVPGVVAVENNIVVDTDLEVAVAEALGKDTRTRDGFPGILVGSAFGELFLKGNVPSQAIKTAAGEIASKVTGVTSVSNQLVAPEPPKPAAPAKPAVAKPAAKPAPKPAEEDEEAPAEE